MAGSGVYRGVCVVALLLVGVSLSTVGRALLGGPVVSVDAPADPASHAHKTRTLLAQPATECRAVHGISGVKEKCDFVTNTKSCSNSDGFFKYNDFVYCKVKNVPGAMTVLALWLLFAFIGLAVCADDFFCPSLVVISKTLRLSPNVAGVTFLAFGNGAPDFFSAITALSKGGDPGLGIGGLFGAGMFVMTVVVGSITIVKPFKAMERPFLRDNIFYMAAIYLVFYVLWRQNMYVWEAGVLVGLYVAYVITVILSGLVYKKQKEARENKLGNSVILKQTTLIDKQSQEQSAIVVAGTDNKAFEAELDNNTVVTEKETSKERHRENSLSGIGLVDETPNGTPLGDAKENEKEKEPEEEEERQPLPPWYLQILMGLNPINVEEWPDMAWYGKAYDVFKSPILFFINFTCPVVSYDDEIYNNWNKYLQCLQVFSAPIFCVFLIRAPFVSVAGGFQLWMLMLAIGTLFGLIVFLTSKADEKPIYHAVFGYIGFFISLIWIYVIANEIVSLLETFGVVINISNAILGLTLLSWGNSIGDWVSNTVMARQGFARMGFAACFGAPLFNVCLGFGIPILIQTIQKGENSAPLTMTPVTLVLVVSLLVSIGASIVVLPLMKFKVNRAYGIFLLCLYIIFLVVVLLTETKVILKDFRPQ